MPAVFQIAKIIISHPYHGKLLILEIQMCILKRQIGCYKIANELFNMSLLRKVNKKE